MISKSMYCPCWVRATLSSPHELCHMKTPKAPMVRQHRVVSHIVGLCVRCLLLLKIAVMRHRVEARHAR